MTNHKIIFGTNPTTKTNYVSIGAELYDDDKPYFDFGPIAKIPVITTYNPITFVDNKFTAPDYYLCATNTLKNSKISIPKNIPNEIKKYFNDKLLINILVQEHNQTKDPLELRPHPYVHHRAKCSQEGYSVTDKIMYSIGNSIESLKSLSNTEICTHQESLNEYQKGIVYSPDDMHISNFVKLDLSKSNKFYSLVIAPEKTPCLTLHYLIHPKHKSKIQNTFSGFNKSFGKIDNNNLELFLKIIGNLNIGIEKDDLIKIINPNHASLDNNINKKISKKPLLLSQTLENSHIEQLEDIFKKDYYKLTSKYREENKLKKDYTIHSSVYKRAEKIFSFISFAKSALKPSNKIKDLEFKDTLINYDFDGCKLSDKEFNLIANIYLDLFKKGYNIELLNFSDNNLTKDSKDTIIKLIKNIPANQGDKSFLSGDIGINMDKDNVKDIEKAIESRKSDFKKCLCITLGNSLNNDKKQKIIKNNI